MWTERPHSKDFYPRSPCGERLWNTTKLEYNPIISIHALLAESDRLALRLTTPITGISIHALLAESDNVDVPTWIYGKISIHALLAESDVASVLEAGGS